MRIHYNSPIILSFALISLFALILGFLTNQTSTMLLFSVHRGSLTDLLFYFRLFGHILGHSSWEHYINNFLLILIIGPMLEEKYGSKKMLYMILITAFVTGVSSIVVSNNVLLGSSGIVFMLILLSSFTNLQKGTIPITLILVVVAYIGREITNGIIVKDNISQFAHVIGGICGGIFGFATRNGTKNKVELEI